MGGGILDTKNAFTLIELLAIIVILAIIAVITVPIILNIIENSRKGAATDSAYGYKDAVNKWYVQELSKPNNENFNLKSQYTVEDGKLIDPTINNDEGILIPFSGDKPSSGYLNYSNNTLTSGCLVFGDYAVTFDGNTANTVKGTCSSNSGGNNEQGSSGSGQSGNQTPTNPYLTTFDGNYVYKYYGIGLEYDDETGEPVQEWESSFDSADSYVPLSVYYRKNISTNLEEYCGIFGSGQLDTVCFAQSLYDYECVDVCDDITGNCNYVCSTTGYTASKVSEFESKGATCTYDSNGYVECENENLGLHCSMGNTGQNNHCSSDNGSWCSNGVCDYT